MRKKKIGIFTGYFLPHTGGVERYVDKLSKSLRKLGYEIVIITSNHNNNAEYEKHEIYSIYRLPIMDIVRERYPIPKLDSQYRKLIRQVADEELDFFIVNTRFHLTSLIGARMGRRLGKPVMLIEHGTDHFTVGNKLFDFFGSIYEHLLTMFVKRYVDKFYGVSRSCNVWSKHFSINASGIFYNAVDKQDEFSVKDYYKEKYEKTELVIAYVGRIIKEKGVVNLLDAFMQLRNERPELNVRLVIAGDGALLQNIRTNYNDKKIDIVGRLDFDHVMSLFKRADIFVYPSLYPEGLPTSILEAGLMECAVIATPRGGTEEVIIDSDHGTIVSGSVEDLHQAIVNLVDNDKTRHRQSKNIKSRIKLYFNWDAVAGEVDKQIREFK